MAFVRESLPEVREALVEQRREIVTFLVEAAEAYKPMTRGAVRQLAAMIEAAGVVCLQCGELQSEVERSQSARRPIHCALLNAEGEETKTWSRHRFSPPRSGS
jgi:hypothetical protein